MAAGAGGLLAAAVLLLVVVGPRPAPAELTDGNSEHLKREHSLMKPYQGERGAGPGQAGRPWWPGLSRALSACCRRGLRCDAAVGLPGQHYGHQPVRPPDARRAQPGGLHLEPRGESPGGRPVRGGRWVSGEAPAPLPALA